MSDHPPMPGRQLFKGHVQVDARPAPKGGEHGPRISLETHQDRAARNLVAVLDLLLDQVLPAGHEDAFAAATVEVVFERLPAAGHRRPDGRQPVQRRGERGARPPAAVHARRA